MIVAILIKKTVNWGGLLTVQRFHDGARRGVIVNVVLATS